LIATQVLESNRPQLEISVNYRNTVMQHLSWNAYMAALEAASTRQDIAPFAALLGGLVQDGSRCRKFVGNPGFDTPARGATSVTFDNVSSSSWGPLIR
jgi:hypothetical protein